MRLLRRRSASAVPPARLIALVPGSEPVLGAVPLDRAGRRWAVATAQRLLVLDEDGIDAGHDWDGVNRGAWDAEARTFTLELLGGTEPLPSGRRATASVRRRADGSLYSVTDPPLGEDGALDADDVDALLALERRVRDGVGLTTS